MGYTNKTSHYELPQYVANDKPSWLGDFNSAMLKIDTVLADNDATAEAANSAATGAQTQVAALSSQLSTIQGQVNTAVDTATAADGKATTAQSVAGQANTTAGEAKTLAEVAKTTADTATATAEAALPKSGGTMSGELLLSGNPTQDNGAATKAYVDANNKPVNVSTTTDQGLVASDSRITLTICGDYLVGVANFKAKGTPTVVSSLLYSLFVVSGNPWGLTTGWDSRKYIGGANLFGSTPIGQSVFAVYDGTNTHIGVVASSDITVGTTGTLTIYGKVK